VIIVFRRSKTPPTAIPIRRKGNIINQIKGYRIRASRASGQQRSSRIHQSRNAIIGYIINTYLLRKTERDEKFLG